MSYVRVTNGTDTLIEGRFDGTDFLFPPGKPVDVPEVVAAHVFGFGKPDKASTLSRLGWLTTSDQMKAAIQRLQLVRIEQVAMVGQIIDEEELPAETSNMVPERIGTVSLNTTAGGSEGGGVKSPPNGPMGAAGVSFDVI